MMITHRSRSAWISRKPRSNTVTSFGPQTSGGLIEQYDSGKSHEGPGHFHQLLGAQRKRSGLLMGQVGQTEAVEHIHADLGGPRSPPGAAGGNSNNSAKLPPAEQMVTAQQGVLHHGGVENQPRRLERAPDARLHPLGAGHVQHILAVQANPALVAANVAGDDVETPWSCPHRWAR